MYRNKAWALIPYISPLRTERTRFSTECSTFFKGHLIYANIGPFKPPGCPSPHYGKSAKTIVVVYTPRMPPQIKHTNHETHIISHTHSPPINNRICFDQAGGYVITNCTTDDCMCRPPLRKPNCALYAQKNNIRTSHCSRLQSAAGFSFNSRQEHPPFVQNHDKCASLLRVLRKQRSSNPAQYH